MKTAIAVTLSAITLSACAPHPITQTCMDARTNGQAFGTPAKKGPCWGWTLAHSTNGTYSTYMIRHPVPGYVVSTVTYRGNEMLQVTTSGG